MPQRLQAGHVITVEPGLYFMPLLLQRAFNDPKQVRLLLLLVMHVLLLLLLVHMCNDPQQARLLLLLLLMLSVLLWNSQDSVLWWKQHATCFSTFVATLSTAAVHALLPCEAALAATTTCHTLIIVLDKATQMLLLCCAAGSAAGQACCSSSAGHGRCQNCHQDQI